MHECVALTPLPLRSRMHELSRLFLPDSLAVSGVSQTIVSKVVSASVYNHRQ